MNASPQLRELAIAYGLTATAMLIGLVIMRADRRAYLRWPVYSVMVMALAVVSWNLLRKHLFPGEWAALHADTMYLLALGLYAAFGFAIGILLGRLARRAPDPGAKPATPK